MDSVRDVTPAYLALRGLTAVLVDLDNTLVGWNRYEPSAGVVAWLSALRKGGVPVQVVSNNGAQRVTRFCRQLGLRAVSSARKPGVRGIERALVELGAAPASTAFVGDRVLTDVVAGNRVGLYTILVSPVGGREWWGTTLIRMFEDRLMDRLLA